MLLLRFFDISFSLESAKNHKNRGLHIWRYPCLEVHNEPWFWCTIVPQIKHDFLIWYFWWIELKENVIPIVLFVSVSMSKDLFRPFYQLWLEKHGLFTTSLFKINRYLDCRNSPIDFQEFFVRCFLHFYFAHFIVIFRLEWRLFGRKLAWVKKLPREVFKR